MNGTWLITETEEKMENLDEKMAYFNCYLGGFWESWQVADSVGNAKS